MSNPVDPTEPMDPVTGDAAAADPEPASASAPAAPRGGLVTLAWWWLALGALGFLLLGSLLTFVGTKASDDGRGGHRMSHQPGRFGPPQGFGPQGDGQRGPGTGPGTGPGGGRQSGPPEQFEDPRGDDGDTSDPGGDPGDEGDLGDDTTDTTDAGTT